MKKILFTFCLLSIYFTHQASDRNFDIQITVDGIKNEEAVLAYNYGEKKFIADTLFFNEKGVTKIQGPKSYADGTYLLVFPAHDMQSFEFVLRETSFQLATSLSDLTRKMKIKNSLENKIMYDDLNQSIQVNMKIDSIQTILKEEQLSDKKKEHLKEEINEISKSFTQWRLKQIEKHPKALYNKILSALRDVPMNPTVEDSSKIDVDKFAYNYYIHHYWDNIDFNDVALIKSPVVIPRVLAFFDKIYQNPDSINRAVDIILDKAAVNKESFEILLSEITNFFAKSKIMSHASNYVYLLDNYFLNGKATWLGSETIEKMRNRADAMRPTLLGKVAPNMTIYDINNQPLNFHQAIDQNDYTVLVFWNSECNHCQKEMPELVEIWQDSLKNNNVGVFSVSTEIEREHIVKFIDNNKMNDIFINGYDPTGRSNFRMLYDITSTPVIVVLDKDKKILAKKIAVKDILYLIDSHRKFKAKE